jgi:predicted esterase
MLQSPRPLLAALLGAAALALLVSPARPQDAPGAAPFPPGTSQQTLEGLAVSIVMPPAFDAAKERSMVVVLHGAGGTETGMAGTLAHLAAEEYVVLAPKSKGQVWEQADLEAVKRIIADLKKRLHVGEKRLHGIGFSNGGWNLAPVAFDEALRFQSAVWVAAGYKGGKPPKHAKKEMGVLALAGDQDPNHSAAEGTVPALEDKVRSVEVRLQPGLDHKWPDKLVPYLNWWLGVQEGRYTPGVCAAFEWKESPAAALEAAASAKSGAFVWWFATAADTANEKAKAFQNDGTRDRMVQRFGQQIAAAKADRDADAEGFAKTGCKTTPAVVVYDAAGKVKAKFEDKIDVKALAAALRGVAPDKSLPKD